MLDMIRILLKYPNVFYPPSIHLAIFDFLSILWYDAFFSHSVKKWSRLIHIL
jgi:hypothetical protein